MYNHKQNGLTLVEMIIVIVVISILATLTILGYVLVQKQSRDSQREASAVVVAEGLEKYYSRNGAYPAVGRVTTPDAAAVRQLLGIADVKSLTAPGASGGTLVNVWKAGSASATNKLTYTANTDTSSTCLTGSGVNDTCTDFKIQYYIEESATVKTIVSRN
jgi:prepilin-type N-terminal cleavage/methylation domain-containing protein